MKQIFLTLAFLLLGTATTQAAPRSRQQAMEIAKKQALSLGVNANVRFLETKNLPVLFYSDPTTKKAQLKATLIDRTNVPENSIIGQRIFTPSSDSNELLSYYIFNNEDNQGWTIVGGDDRLPEIIGYSDEGSFTGVDVPDGILNLLDNYNTFYANLDTEEGDAQAAKMSRVAKKATTAQVGPLLTCSWAQASPYNYYCSMQVSSGVITGCVATAMAQVLYYLKNPVVLNSSCSGYTTETLKKSVNGFSSGRSYDWDNMLDNYSSQVWTQENRNAVALLMYHCGIAVQMDYNTSSAGGSSAKNANIAPALNNYFGVNNCKATTSSFLINTMSQKLKDAIASSTPVIVCGQRNNSGHCYVCDGSNTSGYYHFNWGWGGSYNGYFSIDTMNPGDGSGTYSFSLVVYDIDIPAANKALRDLKVAYAMYKDKTNITIPGNRIGMCTNTSVTDAFTNALSAAKTAIDASGSGYTADQINALTNNLTTTFTNIAKARVPYPDGQYYIQCAQNPDQFKGLYDNGSTAYWNTINIAQSDADNYVWNLTYNSSTGGYSLKNKKTGHYVGTVTKLEKVPLTNTSNEILFEPYSYDEKDGFTEAIRPINQSGNYVYLNQQGNTSSISISGDVVGWTSTNANSAWMLVPVENADPEQRACNEEFKTLYNSMLNMYNAIPEKDKWTGLITKASQFSSPYTEPNEGSFEYLLDRDPSTFWHSIWSNTNVILTAGSHNFIVELNEAISGTIKMEMMRRNNADNDHPTRFQILAGNDGTNFNTDLGVFDMPFTSKDETVEKTFTLPARYKYLKFICWNTYMADGSSTRGYFHMGDFQLYKTSDPNFGKMSTLLEENATNNRPTKNDILDFKTFFSNYFGAGDLDTSGRVTIFDVVKLISYLNGSDTSVDPYGLRDVNLDGAVDTGDLTRLVYIVKTKRYQ